MPMLPLPVHQIKLKPKYTRIIRGEQWPSGLRRCLELRK